MSFEWRTQQVSNRQFSLLREAADSGGISLERMLELSQGTAGSVVRRGFLMWDGGAAFVLTQLGAETLRHFEHTELGRASIDRPLSSFILSRHAVLKSRSRDLLERNHQIVKSRKEQEEQGRSKEDKKKVKDKSRKALSDSKDSNYRP